MQGRSLLCQSTHFLNHDDWSVLTVVPDVGQTNKDRLFALDVSHWIHCDLLVCHRDQFSLTRFEVGAWVDEQVRKGHLLAAQFCIHFESAVIEGLWQLDLCQVDARPCFVVNDRAFDLDSLELFVGVDQAYVVAYRVLKQVVDVIAVLVPPLDLVSVVKTGVHESWSL